MIDFVLPKNASKLYYSENKNGIVILEEAARTLKMNKVVLRNAFYIFYNEQEIIMCPIASGDVELVPQMILGEALEELQTLKEVTVIGDVCNILEDFCEVIAVPISYHKTPKLLTFKVCCDIYAQLFYELDASELRQKFDFVMGNVENIYV